jgi:UDP-2,3-diacylglucosamine hydrolase
VDIDRASWAEEYYRFAQKKFAEGFDYVIMGHIHFPLIRENHPDGKTFVSCGDWITQFTYTKYDGKTLSLKAFGDQGTLL